MALISLVPSRSLPSKMTRTVLPRSAFRDDAGELGRLWLERQRLGLHLAAGFVEQHQGAVETAERQLLLVGPKRQAQRQGGLARIDMPLFHPAGVPCLHGLVLAQRVQRPVVGAVEQAEDGGFMSEDGRTSLPPWAVTSQTWMLLSTPAAARCLPSWLQATV